ncbi:MAG: transcription elongation factor subunit Spt4 [archaeon]
MKKKACKTCKILVDGNDCSVCKTSQLSTSWQGRLNVLDVNKSLIADKIGIKVKGEYAIKVR